MTNIPRFSREWFKHGTIANTGRGRSLEGEWTGKTNRFTENGRNYDRVDVRRNQRLDIE
jgi:hypothetical protein